MTADEFRACAARNPLNAILLSRLRDLALPQGHLVAGCLFQAVWNLQAGRPADHGVKDYDIFYFDDADLGWDAEDRVVRRVRAAVADLGVDVDVKNQARVHLWYGQKFGSGYPQLTSARDGIGRYLVACTCIGIAAQDESLFAPFGFDELERGLLRINPHNPRPALFHLKAQSYRARWPFLTVVEDPAE